MPKTADSSGQLERLSMDSEGSKGEFEKWAELPPEMKLECVKKMDFKMRSQLRATSRVEKSLDESQKSNIEIRWFNVSGNDIDFNFNSGEEYSIQLDKYQDESTRVSILARLLESHVIENFWSDEPTEIDFKNLADGLKPESVFVKMWSSMDGKIAFPVLQKCWKSIDGIILTLNTFKDIPVCFPEIDNAKEVSIMDEYGQLKSPKRVTHVIRLIEKWIENDAEIGRILTVESLVRTVQMTREIFKFFEYRKVWKEENGNEMKMCVETDWEEKKILMSAKKCEKSKTVLWLAVVPTGLDREKCSEYAPIFLVYE